MGRLILTQAVGFHDTEGDRDHENITWQYKKKEGTPEERMAVYNAVRGVDKTMRFYEIPSKENEDVHMELVELESVAYGNTFKARILLEVSVYEEKIIFGISSGFFKSIFCFRTDRVNPGR